MYEVLVLACLLTDPQHCIELENTRHPISTHKQCENRAMEMGTAVNDYMIGWKAVSWKCNPLKKGRLT